IESVRLPSTGADGCWPDGGVASATVTSTSAPSVTSGSTILARKRISLAPSGGVGRMRWSPRVGASFLGAHGGREAYSDEHNPDHRRGADCRVGPAKAGVGGLDDNRSRELRPGWAYRAGRRHGS